MRHPLSLLTAVVLLILLSPLSSKAQTSAFTYQGRLSDSGTPATGTYDLQFALFDSLAGGGQVGSTQTVSSVSVSAGIFSVSLDFGASAFPGANRWLEIRARLTTTPSFTTLSPRQAISSSPYAVRAVTATTADNLNTGGTITGNIVNATSQINLNGNRVVGLGPNASLNNFLVGLNTGNALTTGRENTFIGLNAGQSMTGGTQDCANCGPGGVPLFRASHSTFVGFRAGASNTIGGYNTFLGSSAGASNVASNANSFFGSFAGALSTSGSNSFFGSFAGARNVGGGSNAFFGTSAGTSNITGSGNAFFGALAGSLSLGTANSFFGMSAGGQNTAGEANSFFGFNAGNFNLAGSANTVIGSEADLGGNNLVNATAIGANARVDQSDSLVLGSIAGVNNATNSVRVGIGTTTPQASLDVNGTGVFRPAGLASPRAISFTSPNSETGMIINGPSNRADVRFDGTTLKLVAGEGGGPPGLSGVIINTSGNVGIGLGPGSGSIKLDVNGEVRVASVPLTSSAVTVCLNFLNVLVQCGGSSLRLKSNVRPFFSGLDIVRRLNPISFSWKEGGQKDIGLAAEDVAKVAPSLTFVNTKGEAEGVKYERLNIVLINAIKQQQEQIEQLQRQQKLISQQQDLITQQRQDIASLKKLVCRNRRRTGVCK